MRPTANASATAPHAETVNTHALTYIHTYIRTLWWLAYAIVKFGCTNIIILNIICLNLNWLSKLKYFAAHSVVLYVYRVLESTWLLYMYIECSRVHMVVLCVYRVLESTYGIHCNMTLLFSLCQVCPCVFLLSYWVSGHICLVLEALNDSMIENN